MSDDHYIHYKIILCIILVFFASWRLGWTILIWLFVLILIVLLFRCLRTLAGKLNLDLYFDKYIRKFKPFVLRFWFLMDLYLEGIGVYLESALDHLGVPVSRCQTSREQDICRANRHLRAPSPSLRRISGIACQKYTAFLMDDYIIKISTGNWGSIFSF